MIGLVIQFKIDLVLEPRCPNFTPYLSIALTLNPKCILELKTFKRNNKNLLANISGKFTTTL